VVHRTLASGALLELVEFGRIGDRYVDHGDPALQLASCGLNRDGILASIRARLSG